MYVEGGRTHWKIRFYRIHYKNIIVRAPCDKDGAWILKWFEKRNTSVEGLAGQEVELINTPTANLLCTFPTHWVSSRPETTATENLIMSLFDQLLIMFLQTIFFTATILLSRVRDTQCKTSESPWIELFDLFRLSVKYPLITKNARWLLLSITFSRSSSLSSLQS